MRIRETHHNLQAPPAHQDNISIRLLQVFPNTSISLPDIWRRYTFPECSLRRLLLFLCRTLASESEDPLFVCPLYWAIGVFADIEGEERGFGSYESELFGLLLFPRWGAVGLCFAAGFYGASWRGHQ